ncbi:MAG: DUF962 domain-containing protein [Rhodoferax sp.]|nr:DUF962 domain-containing protein [Rhodoferax sp.]
MINTTDNAATQEPVRRVDRLLAHYAASHRHPTNERIHCIAIPCIMLSLIGLLYAASPPAALLFLAASLVYYWRLSAVFLLSMMVVTLCMLVIVAALHAKGILLPTSLALFVVAWVFQFVGHRIEGKKPSFFEDVQYLWVGPLFVLSLLFNKVGLRW